MNKWRWFLPPVTKVRNYFGEKIAFYVHYLNFLTLLLIIPAIVGIPVFVLQVIYDEDSDDVPDYSNAFFAAFIVSWAVVFYELWKREETKYTVIWGQSDFEEDQVERVEFSGIIRRSPIDDNRDTYFSSYKKILRILVSITITLLMIAIVIAIIIGLFNLKSYLFREWEGEWYQAYVATIVSTINAIQIFIFNFIFNLLASILTRFENHKTRTTFERSLITKTFVFQFVNSFNSLFYIAFIKRDEEGCLDDNGAGDLVLSKDNTCFRELYVQLRSIFIIAIIKNVNEIALPLVLKYMSGRKKTKFYKKLEKSDKDEHKLLARIETSMDRGVFAFQDIDGTYWDYLELMIQAGYFLLFGLAFPLCFLLALINNVIEHQVDKTKLVHFKRRPDPTGANSIGVWKMILYFLSTMGVFTHAAIL